MMQNKLKKEFTRTAGSRRSVTGRLLFLSLLLFTFLGGARAQETLTVCDGTTSNPYVPFYGLMADKQQQNQMIYPATELTSMVGKEITQMVFYCQVAAPYNGNIGDWVVSLGETEATTLDGIDNTTPLTEVYSGPMTFNSDKTLMAVTFDAGYVYNGGNLLVEFNHPVTAETSGYFFLGVEASGASYSYSSQRDFLPKVTFRYETPSSCPKPSALAATTDGSDVTLTWTSNATSFDVVYSTEATDNPSDLTPVQVTDNTYTVTGLAAGDYYFWVRANCSDAEHSNWVGPKSVLIGYCTPAPTSVDNFGISNVTFGMGDNVVNNDTPKAFYADYSNLIGALPAGIESTVAITYDTGYTYGTIIWVDWNNSMSFEDNEIVYTGTSESTRPFTLNATFTIPATQAPGDYRMRIGGADSAFDGFIAGTSTTAPNPCYSSSFACFQDYTLRVTEAPSCLPPTGVTVNSIDINTAEVSWTSDNTSFDVVYSTDAAANPNDLTPVTVSENIYTITNLPLGDHYFWVRANCSDTEHSYWAGPKSVHIGYCTPAPTSVDGNGITNVTFGMGDVVNNNTPKAVYADYTDKIGALPAGVESTVAITYETGYTYGTIIWVDFDNSMSFEDNEIVYMGTSEKTKPFTLNATFTIPATQAPGDYRMRIGGTDYAFDSFIAGSPTAEHSPCYSGSYTCFQDYTLRVTEAPSCLPPTGVTINYTGGTTAEVSWTSDATVWNIDVNGVVTEGITNPYTLTNLDLATSYVVKVQANCGEGDTSFWSNAVSFITDLCEPENQCAISYTLGVSDSQYSSWSGTTIKVVHHNTGAVVGELAYSLNSATNTGELNVCNGETYDFFINSTQGFPYITFTLCNAAGDVIADENLLYGGGISTGTPIKIAEYTVNCSGCKKPQNLSVSELTTTSATVTWEAGDEETQWAVSYYVADMQSVSIGGPIWSTPELVTETTYTIEDLRPNATIGVRVQSACGEEDLSIPATVSFITPMCEPEDQCAISYTLGVSDSQYPSWSGTTIKVVHQNTGAVVGELAYSPNPATNTGELNVCNGETYDFFIQSSSGFPYITFTLCNAAGDVIADENLLNLSGGGISTGTPIQFAEYTVNCSACKKPQNLSVSELTTTSATVTWEAGDEETQWAVSYKDVNGESEEILNVDFAEQTASLPEGSLVFNVNQGMTPIDDWNLDAENGALASVTSGSILFIPVQFGGKAQFTVSGNNSNGIFYFGCYKGSIENFNTNTVLSSSGTIQSSPTTTSKNVQLDMSGYEGNGYLFALHFGNVDNVAYLKQLIVTGEPAWSTPILVTETTYTIADLAPGTTIKVRVQSACSEDGLSNPATVSFITPMCEPEDQCAISYTLGVSDSQSTNWYGATINVVHHNTGVVVGELTYSSNAATNTGELSLCNGETYDFVFNNPQSFPYFTFTLTAPDGHVIGNNANVYYSGKFAEYTMDCDAIRIPQNLTVSEITTTSATMTWEAGGDETQWAVSYRDVNAEGNAIIDEDFDSMTSLPEDWKCYTSNGDGSLSPASADSWNIVDGNLVSNSEAVLFIPIELGGKAKLTVRGNNDNAMLVMGCYQGSLENLNIFSINDYINAHLSTTSQEVEFDMGQHEGNGYLLVEFHNEIYGEDITGFIEQLTVTKSVWSEPVVVETPTYTIEGLEPETTMQVRVRTVSGESQSYPVYVSFFTSYCEPENQCEISYSLGVSNSYYPSWYDATIKVVHSSTGKVVGELTYSSDNAANTGSLNLCIGETYDFVFVNPEGFPYITYTIRDSEGTVIASCTSSPEEGLITQYTVNCNLCKTPKNLTASEVSTTSATVTWKAGGDETLWAVSYKDVNAEDETIIDEDFEELTSLPNGWEIYSVNTSNGNLIPSSDEDWTLANGELTTDESYSTLVIPVEFGGKARVTLDGSNVCILLSYQGNLADLNMAQLSASDYVSCSLSTTPQEFVLDMSDYDGNGYLMVMNIDGTTNLGQLSVTGRGAWSEPVLVNEPEYTLEGLEPGTYTSLRVQAACSEESLSSPAYISFITPFCDPQYQCAISYELGITNSQYTRWYNASIKVVSQSTGKVAGKLEYTQGAENTGELFLCNGETYDFVFDNPAGFPFASFTIYGPDGNVIVTEVDIPNNGSGSLMGEELYVHSCGYDFAIINDAKNNSAVISENNGQTLNVLLKDRTLYKDGDWNTITLPFEVNLATDGPLAGAEVRELESTNVSGSTITLTFSNPVTTIEAGKPYIIKWETPGEDLKNPLFENVFVNADDVNNFDNGQSGESHIQYIGIYDAIDFNTEDKSILFLGTENTLYYPLKGASVNACRAYFKIGDGTGNARQFVLKFGNDTPTSIATLTDGTKDEWYDLSGRRVKRAPAKGGVYVTSGRKVVVK